MSTVTSYLMNPAEDVILFGHELAEGMWVLPEDQICRPGIEASEEEQLRGQRFRRVTRLHHRAPIGNTPELLVFVGEWVDGYQQVHSYALTHAWIVKKDPAS